MLFMRSRETRDFFEFLASGVGCVVVLVLFLAFLALLAAVARALARVDRENRLMEPEQVWLCLIPVVNFVWLPVTVDRVGESFRNELAARGKTKKREGYGKSAGFITLFLAWSGALLLPVGVVFWFIALIYAGVYWVLVNGYARRLKESEDDFGAPVDEGW
jgi:Flp pilus assembly protein TadB